MPVHVDIRINNDLIHRIHIGRMEGTSMQPDSVNTYSVVDAVQEPKLIGETIVSVFPSEPTWFQWEEGAKFTHRYGDGALAVVLRGLEALLPVSSRESELATENAALKEELERVRALLGEGLFLAF